jgi:hypothetical protein
VLTIRRPFRRVSGALALVAAVALAPSGLARQDASTQSVDLKPAMTLNEENTYTFRTETRQTMQLTGTPQAARGSEVESTMRVKVRDVNAEGVATVQFVYDRMKVRVLEPSMGEMEFDSNWPIARDAGNAIAAPTRALVGKTIIALVGPGGELRDLQTPSTEGLDPQTAQMMSDLVNRDSFKQLTKLLYGLKVDPTTATVGEPWIEESFLPSGMGSIRVERKHELESVIADKAYVNIGGDITLQIDPAKPQPPEAQHLEWNGGSVKGRVIWDAEHGRLEKFEISTVIDTADKNPAYNGNKLTIILTSKSSLVRRV